MQLSYSMELTVHDGFVAEHLGWSQKLLSFAIGKSVQRSSATKCVALLLLASPACKSKASTRSSSKPRDGD